MTPEGALFRRAGTSPLIVDLTLDRAAIGAGEPAWPLASPSRPHPRGLRARPQQAPPTASSPVGGIARRRAADNEDRMRVLATMSHELRSPLTGLLGQVELLTEARRPEPGSRRPAWRGCGGGAMMRIVVDRVTDVARPEDHGVRARGDPNRPGRSHA